MKGNNIHMMSDECYYHTRLKEQFKDHNLGCFELTTLANFNQSEIDHWDVLKLVGGPIRDKPAHEVGLIYRMQVMNLNHAHSASWR